MRRMSSFLLAFLLVIAVMPAIAVADTSVLFGSGVPGRMSWQGTAAGHYVHPFDDGYDDPFGYGEYAEYGPWVSRRYVSCQVIYRMNTGGSRRRAVWACE